MEKTNLIPVKEFCSHHHVEVKFIEELTDFGLIETKVIKQNSFFYPDQLSEAEKLVRLHQDLHINPEGLHAVTQLLSRLETLHNKIRDLENQLDYYNHFNAH